MQSTIKLVSEFKAYALEHGVAAMRAHYADRFGPRVPHREYVPDLIERIGDVIRAETERASKIEAR